jgi:hypothetical protein
MPTRFRPAFGLAMVLATALLSGCGSSNSSTSTPAAATTPATGATATKAQFVAQAESICGKLSKEEKPLEASQASLTGGGSASNTFASLAHQVVALSKAAETKLKAIPRPPADAAAIGTLLASFTQDVTDANTLALAAVKQESTVGEAAEGALRRSIAAHSQLAAEYGTTLCTGAG